MPPTLLTRSGEAYGYTAQRFPYTGMILQELSKLDFRTCLQWESSKECFEQSHGLGFACPL